jgi:hypothetical protein
MRSILIAATTAALLASSALVHAAPIGDVFYIELENHNLTQPSTAPAGTPQPLLGNSAAPYFNSLITPGNPNAAQVSYATHYTNVFTGSTPGALTGSIAVHPSEPNYIWQESGSNYGVFNDSDPGTGTGYGPNGLTVGGINSFDSTKVPSLTALMQAKGKSWTSFQEDMQYSTAYQATGVPTSSASGVDPSYTNPYNGSHQYNFAVKHDGSLFFSATNSPSEASHYQTFSTLAADLAADKASSSPTTDPFSQYNLITPDQYNEMHSALTGGFTYNGVHYTGDQAAVAEGDNFLSIIIPEIMATEAYQDNGAIVLWMDESEGGDTPDYTIPEVVISPLAKGNAYDSTLPYDHSSDLKTLEELFGVYAPGGGFLGAANLPGVNDLSDMFVAGAIPTPEPMSVAVMGIGLLGLVGTRRRRRA